MGASGQFTQVAGPVEYKRKYTLWVLVLLILICWPAAIIYYFTRDKVPVQEIQTYHTPAQTYAPPPPAPAAGAGAGGKFCPACGSGGQRAGGFCSVCGKPIPP